MRIHQIDLTNFKKYAAQSFELHPNFTLFIGDNGSGKTTVLDALAVALGVWLVDVPDSRVGGRNILPHEIRLEREAKPERVLFAERKPVVIRAAGEIAGLNRMTWARQIREDGKRTSNAEAKDVLAAIKGMYKRDEAGDQVTFPIIAYYGAGRTWLPSNSPPKKGSEGPSRRWNAFYDCLYERIRFGDVQEWFKREAIAAGSSGGRIRAGFHAVRQAVFNCVPDADGLRFDPDLDEPVLSIAGRERPLSTLSAGQRMMFAMVADIAIKMVTQNAALLVGDVNDRDCLLPLPMRNTPGVVLIDELDVHLHPKWQRRVATDLKQTFPNVQFVCTSHSPQVIGEVRPDEIRILTENDAEEPRRPPQSKGMDSNWILEVVQRADERDPEVKRRIKAVFEQLARKELKEAEKNILELRKDVGNSGDIQRAASQLERLKILGP